MRRYLRAIVCDLDTRPVELLTAQLSAWFALVLITSDAPTRPQPWWLWSAWCALSAGLKVAGLLPTLGRGIAPAWSWGARVLGAFLGLGFWTVLTTVLFLLVRGGIGWGGFLIVGLAQGWVLVRLIRRG